MNKNESRYFHTAVRMDEALISLLEKKEFAYITVKEVCETAGVNRSTFYLHYENTAELLTETSQYMLDKLFSYYRIDRQEVIDRLERSDWNELIFTTRDYLIPYLTFVKENKRLFKVALRQFHTLHMDSVYERMFTHIFDPVLARFRVPEEERPYVIKFYLTGVLAIVMEWLEQDCADDMERVVRIIHACVSGGRHVSG